MGVSKRALTRKLLTSVDKSAFTGFSFATVFLLTSVVGGLNVPIVCCNRTRVSKL